MNIKKNLQHIDTQINLLAQQYHQVPNNINLLAVSKTKPVDLIQQAYDWGQRNFAENYLQEAVEKIAQLKSNYPDIVWHFIGKLQSNKAKIAAETFDWVQSIDSLKLAEKLNKFRPENLPVLNICIQVNITNESQKSGVAISEINQLAEKISQLPRLKLRGLMAMGYAGANNMAKNKACYQNLYQVFQGLKSNYSSIDTLSLGMSQDMALAIEHGSTMVRVGTAIFGERK